MATIHPQRPNETLPSGWESRLDPRTGRYYFINHAEHTTTWEDPRTLHPQVQQGSYAKYYLYGIGKSPSGARKGYPSYFSPVHYTAPTANVTSNNAPSQGVYTPYYGTPRTPIRFKPDGMSVQVDERLLMKLCLQFPSVEEGHIWQFLKQYHNRETVVISALMAEGHPRAQIHPTAHEQVTPKLHRVEQMVEPLPPTADEALVHKLHGYFPNVDIDSIRSLVKKFNNQEHEIIASLVSGSWKGNRFPTTTPSSPKMKLRYLKLVFPEADEAVLFDILYNCDNNAYEASNRLSTMGYKKRDTPIIRPNANQQPKPNAEESRPKKPDRPVIVGPPSISDKQLLMARIQEQFPAVSKTLVNMALDSSNYNEERAISFLKAMTPMDGTSHKFPTSESAPAITVSAEETAPTTSTSVSPTIPIQDGTKVSFDKEDIEGVAPPVTVEVSDADLEISITKDVPTPKSEGKQRSKFKRDIMKITRSTNTSEEQSGGGYTSAYRVKAKGPDSSLRKGPCEDLLLKDYVPWVGADAKNRRGADPSLHKGPDAKNLGHRESLAKGPCRDYKRGPLADITHALRASRVSDN